MIVLQQTAAFQAQQNRPLVGPVTGTMYSVNALGQVEVDDADVSAFMSQGWLRTTYSGTAVVDFGAFPGSLSASTTVSGVLPSGDISGPIVCQIIPVATVDHSADEHAVDGPTVSAQPDGNGNLIISAYPNTNVIPVDDMMPWGKWTVAWFFVQ